MPSQRRNFAALSAVAYLLLCGSYLLYWNHVEYFTDDWFLLEHHRAATSRGPSGVAEFIASAIQNRIYGIFRSQWFSILYGFLVTQLGGRTVKFNFACLLLLHAACAWLLAQALSRFGLDRAFSFLAGALYLLMPTVHFTLFTYLTNPFFVFSTFWILAMLCLVAQIDRRWAAMLPACAVAALFSGEQVFLLAWMIAPLALWCFGQRPLTRAAAGAVAATWGALASSGVVFLLWINRAPVTAGLDSRYIFSMTQLGSNLRLLWREWRGASGFGLQARFKIAPAGIDWLLAAVAAAAVAGLLWRWASTERAPPQSKRAWLLGLGGMVLAYVPVLWISGDYPRLRYHYVPSPFLGIVAAAACCGLARLIRFRFTPTILGGLLAGLLVLNAAADLRQCWILQSRHQRALEAAIRQLKGVAPGDILVISGTPYEIGTAQHFSMHSTVSAKPFVEWAAGVAPLEAALDLVDHHGALELYHRDVRKHISASDLRRVHLLVSSRQGTFSRREWVAVSVPSGSFRLLPLKHTEPAPAGAEFTREQLELLAGRVYFPRTHVAD